MAPPALAAESGLGRRTAEWKRGEIARREVTPSVRVREGVVAAGVGRRAWSPDSCDGRSRCGARDTDSGRVTAGVLTGHRDERPLRRSPPAGREASGGAEFAFGQLELGMPVTYPSGAAERGLD